MQRERQNQIVNRFTLKAAASCSSSSWPIKSCQSKLSAKSSKCSSSTCSAASADSACCCSLMAQAGFGFSRECCLLLEDFAVLGLGLVDPAGGVPNCPAAAAGDGERGATGLPEGVCCLRAVACSIRLSKKSSTSSSASVAEATAAVLRLGLSAARLESV